MTQTLTQADLIQFDLPAHKVNISWRDRAYELSYWTEAGIEKENLLQKVMDLLVPCKYFIAMDRGWSDWDLEIYQGIWSKVQLKVCAENHGGNKRVLRVRCALRMSQLAMMAMVGYCLLAIVAIVLGMPEVAKLTVALCTLNATVILYQNFQLGRILYQVLEIVAKRVYLLPIQTTNNQSVAESVILQP
ncbi:MAG: hypothetical protein RM368_10650 [Nostoc sp. DedSLP03]|uniref:hypothetical protein n=1 Tax=Nostoc sp. DedSLP03 TaxID=3075400 RepID=UPI002AD2D2F4|nr:hypothetical protein [Nostoc sp. DedSLP03]MDZ7965421.1 hypothetical protein [Nostoc sp. DedSLP03]